MIVEYVLMFTVFVSPGVPNKLEARHFDTLWQCRAFEVKHTMWRPDFEHLPPTQCIATPTSEETDAP